MHNEPGQDLLAQSVSGLVQLTGGAGAPPTPAGTALVDQHAAALGAMGVLGALVRKARTGEGTKIDSNLLSAALDLQIEPLNYYLNGFPLYPRSKAGISTRFHQAPYGVFQASDGWITVSVTATDKLFRALDDPWFDGLEPQAQFDRREEVNAHVAAAIRLRKVVELEEAFAREGIWFAPVNDYGEVVAHPQVKANGSVLSFEHERAGTVSVLGHPLEYDGQSPEIRRLPPYLGQHTDELLEQLGYTTEQVNELYRDRVVGGRRRVDWP
jgi:crotonobetainyl-CoA:carnitine CoA-transferase CaiB-like acyl-CoA transferase